MAKLTAPTEQETFDHIFGSGCISYGWWASARSTVGGWDFSHPAPNGWALEVEVDNPEGEGDTLKIVVDHKALMRAIRAIAGRTIKTVAAQQPGPQCLTECRNFLFNRDAVDFDADTADQVLQVACLGAVFYG